MSKVSWKEKSLGKKWNIRAKFGGIFAHYHNFQDNVYGIRCTKASRFLRMQKYFFIFYFLPQDAPTVRKGHRWTNTHLTFYMV